MESSDCQGREVRKWLHVLYVSHTALLITWLTAWDIILLLFGFSIQEQMSGIKPVFAVIAATGVMNSWIHMLFNKWRIKLWLHGETYLGLLVVMLSMLPVTWVFFLPYQDKPISYRIITLSLAVLTVIASVVVWIFWWRFAVLKGYQRLAD